jgi:hypothetical protein
VSLVIDAVVVVGGIALGRWIIRRARASRSRGEDAGMEGATMPEPPAADPFASLPCKVGDVVMRSAERDEAWLAGALVFAEEKPVAVLFAAPEAGGDRAVYARVAPGAGLVWLAPLPPAVVRTGGDPPHSLEVDGVRYERARRLPVSVSRAGSSAPSVGDRAVVAEYTGPANARLLVVAGSDATLGWRGVALGEGEYDVLPGDGDT